FRDKLRECDGMAPTELLMSFARVAQKLIDLGRPEVARIYSDNFVPGLAANAYLVASLSTPFDLAPHLLERELHKLANRVHLTRCQYEITRCRLLQDSPHPLDEVARVAPIPLSVKITEV